MTNSGQNENIDVSKAFIFRIYNMFYLKAASKFIRRLKKTLQFFIVRYPTYNDGLQAGAPEGACHDNV